ncbi:putative rhamnosyl transferase [Salinibacter ruber]|uniref:putative rhamnosyl transferase n=1 Tax=Salinibacter ruber TaxID=146919 RepID=UPI0021673E94|nr:putative rhamnosyl transferase [Salinibacter ruber]MCS4119429.1 hypothetical protein [Salinibacter ruber]
MKFANYIVTRFNVEFEDLYEKHEDKSEWMKERKELFMKYCYPSILNQRNKNFEWLILISPQTSNKNMKFFEEISDGLNIKYVEAENFSEVDKNIEEYVKKNLEKGDYVATTRVDTDDILNIDFVNYLEKVFDKQKRQPISWARGYQMITSGSQKLRKVKYPKGPFKTLIERYDGSLETVYARRHGGWNDQIELYDDVYWIQTIHGNNVSGDVINGVPIKSENLKYKFGVDIHHQKSLFEILPDMIQCTKLGFKQKVLNVKKIMGIE